MRFFTPRKVLSAVALMAAMSLIASAVPRFIVPGAQTAHRHGYNFVMAEVKACEARGDRSQAECVDEAQGKALIRRAEWLTRLQAQQGVVRGDDLDDAIDAAESARSLRSGTQ